MSRKKSDEPIGLGTQSLSSMGFLLHRAQWRLRNAVVEAIEGSGLIPGQLALLGVLSDRGGMSQRQLCELAQIEKSSMVIFLDALEKDGWVRRERDPSDRRAHIVQLTPEGTRRFHDLGPGLWRAQQSFLKPLTQEEVMTLTSLLIRLATPDEIGETG